MFLVGILSWWYGDGFSRRIQLIKDRLISSIDFFSIDILLSSFFAPFRQISAGNVSGPIGDQIRGFFDKLLSRIIGAVVRSFVIIFGLIVIFLQLLFSFITIIIWLVLPAIPVIGLFLTAFGWLPS